MGKNKREGVEIDSEMSSGEDAGHQDTNQAINSAKLQAGARYKYELLWIVLVASCFALIIQSLAANLGVATGKDLAQHCRIDYPRLAGYILWVLAEVAVIVSDIPEAFALNMLFGIPVWGGVLLTGVSTLILLALQRYGIRKLEFVIAILLFTMAGCFVGELGFAKPKFTQVLKGTFVPQLRGNGATGLVISILVALVMPHNIFLHSALVLLRKIPQSVSGINSVCRYNLMESAFALSLACMINIAVISVSAVLCNSPTLSSENKHNCSDLDVTKSSFLLKHVLEGWSAKVFSIALLASGQSSIITGTYAGQYVMQGFLDLKLTAWLRNLMTRCIAIIPSLIVSTISGSSGAGNLIIISSMILSFDLPFVLIPLLKFTGNKAKMGSHKNSITITVITWGLGLCIIGINMYYVITAFVGCLIHNNLPKAVPVLIGLIVVPAIVLYVLGVVYLAFRPTKKVTYVASEEVPIEI